MDVQFILISKRLYKKLTAWPLWAVCVNCVWFLQDISVKTDIHIILLWPHIISWLPNIYQQTQNLQTWQLNLKGGKGNIQFKDHQKQSLMMTHILVHYSVPWFKLIDWFCQTKGRMEVMKTSGIKMSGWDNIYITKPQKASSITSTIWPTVAKTVLRHDTLITEKHPNKHLHLSKIWGWRHPSNETLNVCLNLDKSVFGCWHNQRWVRLTDVTIISNHVRHHLYHQSCFHILSGCLINNCYFSNRWSSDLVGLDLGLRMVTWAWKRFFTRKETYVTRHLNSSCDPSIDHAWLSLGQYWSRDLWGWCFDIGQSRSLHVQWRLPSLTWAIQGKYAGKLRPCDFCPQSSKISPENSWDILFKRDFVSNIITLFWLWTNDLYHSDRSHISLSFCVSNCLSMFSSSCL